MSRHMGPCHAAPASLLPLALLVWSSVGVSDCAPTETAPALHIFDGATMGTTYAVRVVTADTWDQPRRDRIRDLIQAALDDVESKMSHYRSSSELSRFNQTRATAPFPVSAETFDVIRHAYQLSELTGGALDVTVAPLVNAWGFGPVEPESLPPDAALLARLRDHVGYRKLELDPGASTLRKTDPEIECDLSAVAKGYGVDQVAEVLREEGVTRFMVEVGGEIVAAEALIRQQRRAGEPDHRIARRDAGAVGPFDRDGKARVDQLEGDGGGVGTSDHSVLSGRDDRVHALARRDDGIRRDVPGAAEIFEKGGPHHGLHEEARQRQQDVVRHRSIPEAQGRPPERA